MKLAPAARKVETCRGVIAWSVVLASGLGVVLAIPALQNPFVFALLSLGVVAVLVDLVWVTPAAVRRFRYSISPDGVRTSSGLMLTRKTFVPLQQILVVERRQGPIMRAFGVVKVRLRVPGSYVDIDGVTDEAFSQLQAEVQLALARGRDE